MVWEREIEELRRRREFARQMGGEAGIAAGEDPAAARTAARRTAAFYTGEPPEPV